MEDIENQGPYWILIQVFVFDRILTKLQISDKVKFATNWGVHKLEQLTDFVNICTILLFERFIKGKWIFISRVK